MNQHGRAYSPYSQRSFPNQVYWGETHLHTSEPCFRGQNYDLRVIQPLAAKAPEHALRVAGVLAMIRDPKTNSISEEDIAHATELLDCYYLDEAVRI